ncbi:unnamed protein product, partial [Protopolystoma xenopodis]
VRLDIPCEPKGRTKNRPTTESHSLASDLTTGISGDDGMGRGVDGDDDDTADDEDEGDAVDAETPAAFLNQHTSMEAIEANQDLQLSQAIDSGLISPYDCCGSSEGHLNRHQCLPLGCTLIRIPAHRLLCKTSAIGKTDVLPPLEVVIRVSPGEDPGPPLDTGVSQVTLLLTPMYTLSA